MDLLHNAIPGRHEFNAVMVNEGGEMIGTARIIFKPKAVSDGGGGFDFNFSHNDTMIVFSGVKASKTSGEPTVSIVSVNGMDAKTAGAQGYMSISTKEAIIPWPVTSIGDRAFARGQLTSLTLPDSLTSIGEEAFWENQLTSLTLPDSLTSIGDLAFGRNRLTSLTLPNSVSSIGEGAFSNNRLTSLTLPDCLTSIEDWAFSNNQLTSVTLPDSLTSIGSRAFRENQLAIVALPDGLTSIGDLAFVRNPLTSVTLPANVSLDENALPCQEAYIANGKRAGTYVYVGGRWTYHP
jgi:hypothetical protein